MALGAGASRCGRVTRPPHLPDRPAAETMDGGSAIDEVVKRLPLDDVEAMLSRRGLPSVVHRGAPRRARGLLAAALKDGMCEWTCEAGVQDGYHDRELGRGVAARRGGTPQPAAEPRAEPSSRPSPAIASVHCSLHVIGDSIFAFGSSDKHQDQFTVWRWDLAAGDRGFRAVRPRSDECDRPSPCMGHFAVAHDGRLYVFPVHPGSQSGPAWAFRPRDRELARPPNARHGAQLRVDSKTNLRRQVLRGESRAGRGARILLRPRPGRPRGRDLAPLGRRGRRHPRHLLVVARARVARRPALGVWR